MPEPAREKRRLPVVGNPEPEPERPRHQWVLLTAVATLLTWLLVASLVVLVVDQFELPLPAVIALHLAALFLGALGAGALAGRFGRLAQARHAMLGSAIAALLGVLLAMRSTEGIVPLVWVAAAAIVVGISALGARLGHRLGRRNLPTSREA